MASTRVTINVSVGQVAAGLQAALNNISETRRDLAQLRKFADAAYTGDDAAALAALFGVAEAQAADLIDDIRNLDNYLNNDPSSYFLSDLLARMATR